MPNISYAKRISHFRRKYFTFGVAEYIAHSAKPNIYNKTALRRFYCFILQIQILLLFRLLLRWMRL